MTTSLLKENRIKMYLALFLLCIVCFGQKAYAGTVYEDGGHDSFETAIMFQAGDKIKGEIAASRETDIYQFTL